MIYLFHGDDNYQSRQKLFSALKKYQDIDSLSAKEISPESIVKLTGGLFSSQNRALVFNQLFSLPQPRLKKILPLIKELSQSIDIFIWEENKIAPQKISLLGDNVKAYLFRLPANLFKFLDAIGSKTSTCLGFLTKTLKSHPPELTLYLVEKRLRELLLAKINPEALKLASWQKSKLLSQVKKLDLEEIKQMYLKLIEIDWKNKTGQLGNSLENELVLLVTGDQWSVISG